MLLVAIVLALRIGAGASTITWGELFNWMIGREIDARDAQILTLLRLPRALMAVTAGAILASAGVVYQALLRNPLASPYTLGVSGGATFGAVLTIALSGAFGLPTHLQSLPVISTAALMGAAVAIGLIYALARSAGRFSPSTIILAGVTLNLLFGSLILLLQYLSDFTQVYEMIRWMMGGLDIVGLEVFWPLGALAVAGLGTIGWFARDLDLVAVDPLAAATLGVRVGAVRWGLLLVASLMTGCVLAFCGPIGFIGLIVPHCVRMVLGASHARVLPASIIAGAIFLLACDTAAQNILGDEELPVGVITAMLGGPFFLWLLLSRRGGSGVWMD